MKHSERFALDHFLSEYPRDLPFDEVIDRILDDDQDEISTWQVVENYGPHAVVEMIDSLRHHFECVVNNMIKDLGQLEEGEKHEE